MRPTAALLAAAALPLAGCGDLFVIQVDEPELCITLEGETIPGTEFPTQERELAYDLAPALPKELSKENVELEVELISFAVAPGDAQTDLSFLHEAELWLLDAGENSPLATWKAPADGPAPEVIAFDVSRGNNLGHAVERGALRLQLQMSGVLPVDDWSADARACFRVVGEIHYLD